MSGRPQIRVVRDGPMLVEGLPLTRLVKSVTGMYATQPAEPSPGDAYALCRCGRSTVLPLCDAQPPYGCFEEEGPGGPLPKPVRWEIPDPSRPGLALKPNGPVRVAGPVSIRTDGGDLPPTDRVSLCRCGTSRSQPLCDGSHKVVGYREPVDPPPANRPAR
jgi:CDGSH-type Zn-finger protein